MYVHLSAVSASPEESVRSPGAGDTGGREPLGVGAWIAVGISTGAVSAFNLWAIPQKNVPLFVSYALIWLLILRAKENRKLQ